MHKFLLLIISQFVFVSAFQCLKRGSGGFTLNFSRANVGINFGVFNLAHVRNELNVIIALLKINQMQIIPDSLSFFGFDCAAHIYKGDVLVFDHSPLFGLICFLHQILWFFVEHGFSGLVVFFHFVHFVIIFVWIFCLCFIAQVFNYVLLLFKIPSSDLIIFFLL